MGQYTSTPIKINAMDMSMTPEECSAEILQVLYSYLPDEIRNDPSTGTVITIPAAFNQMQRDATMTAVEKAGIYNVALMQEPVAAVMSVMKNRNSDGIFLIYDLGGGTFDVALAETISKRVSLLEHGGITMCGGRDFDRILVDNLVKPWLSKTFNLPDNFSANPKYNKLIRLAYWATELAKIELSKRNESVISLSEDEARLQDDSGQDIYLDISVDTKSIDSLIKPKIIDTIQATRDVLEKAHLSANDIDRIVFIGGPTQYKPLRDLVTFELSISADTQNDPMTAVSEGASIFAESIDWSTKSRKRKSSRGSIAAGSSLNIDFEYTSRTSDMKGRIGVKCNGNIQEGSALQIDNMDTGWSSGQIQLSSGQIIEVLLSKNGANKFRIFLFDSKGSPVSLENNTIIITRTTATVDAIPASHSLGVEVKEKLSGTGTRLKYFVRKGDPLPQKDSIVFKAGEALRSGGPGSLNFKIYEGEIEDPVSDNEFVGTFKITGDDFDHGIIEPGADLICEYEMSDSGKISIAVSVPSISGTFSPDHDFYSRQEGQINFLNANKRILQECENVSSRVDDISETIEDDKIERASGKLSEAKELAQQDDNPEHTKQAFENVLEAKRLLSKVRYDNLKTMRQSELNHMIEFFDENVRQYAKPTECASYENMSKTAQREIDKNSSEFENIIDQMRGMNWQIYWRQDWFIVETFQRFCNEEYMFTDQVMFEQLVKTGENAIKNDQMDDLRNVVLGMYDIRIMSNSGQDMMVQVNILHG